jgi:type II secretory pathway component HofQ
MTTLTATLAIALACCGGGDGADPRAEAMRRLDGLRVTVDFDGVPIQDALDYLREVSGLNLVILPKALEKEPGLKIRLKVKDLSVRSVLKLMLGSRGLAASWRDGAVVILPKEELQGTVKTKLIDVRSLLVRLQDFAGPKVELANQTATGPTPTFTLEDPKPPVVDEELLVRMIRENTGRGGWEENPSASLSLANGMLVVTQTPSVLREVEALLRLLGQYR